MRPLSIALLGLLVGATSACRARPPREIISPPPSAITIVVPKVPPTRDMADVLTEAVADTWFIRAEPDSGWWHPLDLQVGDSASLWFMHRRCRGDVCPAYIEAGAGGRWTSSDTMVAALRSHDRVGSPGQIVWVCARSPGVTQVEAIWGERATREVRVRSRDPSRPDGARCR